MKLNERMKLFSSVLLLVGLLLSIAACKKDNEPVDFHFGYFPIDKGRFVIYQVHEENIDANVNQYDISDYYLKAILGDTVIDNQGRIARRYERYISDNANGPWVLKDIWTTLIESNRAELVEENNRTIKMVFAPTKFKEWNMNAYNILDPLECYYRDIHKELIINGLSFDSTVVVEQEDYPDSQIEYRRKYEIYAKNVGMVYKKFIDQSNAWGDTSNVIKGKKLTMSAIAFGVE
jgi:hypothetical protein